LLNVPVCRDVFRKSYDVTVYSSLKFAMWFQHEFKFTVYCTSSDEIRLETRNKKTVTVYL